MSTKMTYSGDPSSSSNDAVRFAVGDTDANDWIFTDAEVAYSVQLEGSVNEAALYLARAALAKFVRLVSISEKDGEKAKTKALQQKVNNYERLIVQLTTNKSKRVVGVYAGGLTKSDKLAREQDDDRVAPLFTRKLHDRPDTAAQLLDDGEDD